MEGNDIYFIKKNGIVKLNNEQIKIEIIGGKAFGLCRVPIAWSVPFFVISQEMFAEFIALKDKFIISPYITNIKSTISFMKLKNRILLRSSAVNEGLEERGKFDSIATNTNNIEEDLLTLLNELKDIPNKGMPIIVQELISPVFIGHMSNERRFSQEIRDWKVETYYKNGTFEQDTICIRTQKAKYNINDIVKHTLFADFKSVITELQKVAFYWYRLSKDLKCRFHLEFVFNGTAIFIVQADNSLRNENAVNPKSYNIKMNNILEKWSPKVLKQYNPNNFSMYMKLQNVKNYNDLGFCTVPLYVLDDTNIISNLCKGIVCTELQKDIEILLKIQSIVIRMDINCSNKLEKQMLPRSNEIYNYNDVVIWLKEHANIISGEQKGIFIFHNFIPSTSSAFAHAIPNGRLVKIQSLWGLPEGLYYNYHDTIIVDISPKELDCITESDVKVTIKNRYKDLFIYSDNKGNWITCEIKEPYDWKCSIENNESIFEIALKTQKLANKLQKEISVMWFVGIDYSFYGASNLPWFHEEVSFSSYTTDEYKRKYFTDEEIIINNSEELQNLISLGNFKDKRCFRLKPNIEKDLRNKNLIANIGKIAKENNIMILLDGTQLTHSYYQLKSTGAKVVCSDKNDLLYSETIDFNKLVRDKIPEKIISNGEHVKCSIVVRPFLDRMLLEKLLEEAYEVNDANKKDDIISELADLTELSNTILSINSEFPISCKDVLNNKEMFFYRDELIQLITFEISDTISMYTKSYKYENFYIYITIQRQKTLYKLEFNLQDYPVNRENILISKDDAQEHMLKSSIITDVSLALKSKRSDNLINHINNMNFHVKCLCEATGISMQQVIQKRVAKALKVGGFKKGYVLNQTILKDNVIDEINEFNPQNCNVIYNVERESNKKFELLQDVEKNQKRILLKFSMPIAVNEWEIIFNNPKIDQILTNVQSLHFNIHKNDLGKLILTVNSQPKTKYTQLSFFDD